MRILILILLFVSSYSNAAIKKDSVFNTYWSAVIMYEVSHSDPEAHANTIFNAFFPTVTLDDVFELRSALLNSFREYRVSAFINTDTFDRENIKEISVVSENGKHAVLNFIEPGVAKNRKKGEYIDATCKSAMYPKFENGDFGIVFYECYPSIDKIKLIASYDEKADDKNKTTFSTAIEYNFYKHQIFYKERCKEKNLKSCFLAVKEKAVDRLNDYHIISGLK